MPGRGPEPLKFAPGWAGTPDPPGSDPGVGRAARRASILNVMREVFDTVRGTLSVVLVVLAAVWVAIVIAASLITRPDWLRLESSVSNIVGFLKPEQSNLVYLVYGMAILALPFAILIELIINRQWKLLAGYAHWPTGQLQREMSGGAWWLVAASSDFILSSIRGAPHGVRHVGSTKGGRD